MGLFTRLFKKRKPLSEMTPEERAERKIELLETISRAMGARLGFGDWGKVLRCAEELVLVDPHFKRGWSLMVMALDKLGRSAEAEEAANKASQMLGEKIGREPFLR